MKLIYCKYIIFCFLFHSVSYVNGQNNLFINNEDITISPKTKMVVLSDFINKETGNFRNNGNLILKANYENNGNVTFDENYESKTFFEGKNLQNLKGNNQSYFKNVTFSNSLIQGAFDLQTYFSISGNASFEKGIVFFSKTDNTGLFFEELATHSNVSDQSFVDGFVSKKGNANFDFPIGQNNYYRFCSISNQNNAVSTFMARYFLEDSNKRYPHSKKENSIEIIDNSEYWLIENLTNEEENIRLTLSWNSNTTKPVDLINPDASLHIVRWDSNLDKWIDEGGELDATQKTVTSNITKYGYFTIALVTKNEDLKIYNAISANGDGMNDYFLIDGIERFPENNLIIFNRWGRKVFETSNYGVDDNYFKGYSNKGSVSNDMLPSGTYFYILDFSKTVNGKKEHLNKSGYLYLNGN